MKTLTQTIIVTIVLSLLTVGFAPANNASSGESRFDSDINSTGAGIEVVLAQAQTDQPVTSSPAPSPAPAAPTPPTPPTLPSSASVEGVDNNIYNLTRSLSFGSQSGSTGTVLVIPSEQIKIKDLLTINEDMGVMSRIFEKNLEQARISTARGNIFPSRQDPLTTLLGGGRGGIQSIYLQGFGALFLMNVDFPLTPPPDMQDDEKEAQKVEQGDPVWQQMRREMYEPENVIRNRRIDRPEERYDAEKVENLKTTLIKALKHAANIRSLKPDESVILTVTGSSEATGTIITSKRLPGENQIIIQERTVDGKTITKMATVSALDKIGLSSPAILVIRTKKSDIDEFAKGDLDLEKFRQRVQLLTYPLLGGLDGNNNPLDIYHRLNTTSSTNMRR